MNWLLGIVGAALGGVAGYFAFGFLWGQGVYAMVLPGALVGLGCGSLSRIYSVPLGIAAGITSLFLGLYLEWNFLPFVDDDSLSFFLKNLHQQPVIHLIMIAIGGILGFVFGKGRSDPREVVSDRCD